MARPVTSLCGFRSRGAAKASFTYLSLAVAGEVRMRELGGHRVSSESRPLAMAESTARTTDILNELVGFLSFEHSSLLLFRRIC